MVHSSGQSSWLKIVFEMLAIDWQGQLFTRETSQLESGKTDHCSYLERNEPQPIELGMFAFIFMGFVP